MFLASSSSVLSIYRDIFALLCFSSQTHFHFLIILFHKYHTLSLYEISLINFSLTFTVPATKLFFSQMASLQLLKPTFTSISTSHPGKPSWVFRESDSRKRVLRFASSICRNSRYYYTNRSFRVCCEGRDTDNQSNTGEEPPESLFMKELRRRGMTPTSLLEETKRNNYGLENEINLEEEDRGFSNRNAVSTELEKSLSNQRERSMALNSEGLEGLIPRAKLLLTIGGTFFLGFWPLILIAIAFFTALYLYFGSTFVHDGSSTPISPPQYIDPYALLEDERISQIAPRIN